MGNQLVSSDNKKITRDIVTALIGLAAGGTLGALAHPLVSDQTSTGGYLGSAAIGGLVGAPTAFLVRDGMKTQNNPIGNGVKLVTDFAKGFSDSIDKGLTGQKATAQDYKYTSGSGKTGQSLANWLRASIPISISKKQDGSTDWSIDGWSAGLAALAGFGKRFGTPFDFWEGAPEFLRSTRANRISYAGKLMDNGLSAANYKDVVKLSPKIKLDVNGSKFLTPQAHYKTRGWGAALLALLMTGGFKVFSDDKFKNLGIFG